ncbi:flagellar biosynthetic protein FliR [Pseudobdellovibrio exovorus]|uniref:Flagellar biosynthetic protein FliR n=1 Tax=Pseudobdellovibrio exovorus JSS TaxID=1184267 RepID=M4V638_9BACT|nr:flagellar biosynthetic protein FliR [Pseudobdellovibrio exovorus]AGH94832.1 flagellar biosynthetic protein FliR [Pseudobdellovibrio exovorus JSS]
MFNISQLNEVQVLMFALILLRMSAFVVSAAIFSSQSIAAPVKILFSLVFAVVVFPPVATNEALVRLHGLQDQLILLAAREVAIGLILGFVTRLFFFAISMAGEMVSISMGLGQAQIFNPMMGSMGNAMEQFYTVIATLVFLALNGHHLMIQGLVESFNTSPVAQMTFQVGAFAEVVMRVQNFFIIGIKIAAPLMISMMVVQFGVALLSRVVPQINVIMTLAPVTAMMGFIILFISLPLLVMQMSGLMDFSMSEFFKFLKTI